MRVLDGYDLDERGRIIRKTIDTSKPGDYGRDPIGDGLFRMVPSGDVVDWKESERRLSRHVCDFGDVEHARITGNPHRKCQTCGIVSLDLDDDEQE